MLRLLRNINMISKIPRKPCVQSKGIYTQRIVDHFESPRNVGSMDASKPDVGSGLVGAPACGDVIKLQIKVEKDTETIKDVKFKVFGCGSAVASSSVGAEWIKGKTLEEAQAVTNQDIASYLSLPPVKLHCSMLVRDGIRSAIADYKNKNKE